MTTPQQSSPKPKRSQTKVISLVVTVIGIAILAGTAVLGLTPLSTGDYWSNDTVSCGSAILADTAEAERIDNGNALDQDLNDVRRTLGIDPEIAPLTEFAASCDELISERRTWVFVLLPIGVIITLAGLALYVASARTEPRVAS